MGTMDEKLAERCLMLLRRADDILVREHELALAACLSLVIERLAERFERR